MCRSCAEGGRRCHKTVATRTNERAAAKRYYQRTKARRVITDLAKHGVPAVDDLEAPTTYHYGRPPDLNTPRDRDEEALPNKPADALWTAPGRVATDGTVKTGWTDYMAREGYTFAGRDPANEDEQHFDPKILHVVRPTPGAVIARIADAHHARALAHVFPAEEGSGIQSISWAALHNAGVDAVMLTENGTSAREFYGWDAASVAWLHTDRCTLDGSVQRGEYTPNPDATAHELEEHDLMARLDMWDLSQEDGIFRYDEGHPPRLVT